MLLHCGCLSLNPFIEFSIRNNSSSSDVLNIQASISISPKYETKQRQQVIVIYCCSIAFIETNASTKYYTSTAKYISYPELI